MNRSLQRLTTILVPRASARFGHKLVINRHGNPTNVLQLSAQERPKLTSPDNVLLGVLAATVNPADINVVQGFYPVRPALPGVGGIDGVAQVLEVGQNVRRVKVGDRVWPYSMQLGMFQTYIDCPADQVVLADPRLSLIQAATLVANPVTAFLMIKMGKLKSNDTLIQNAGNSAVGQCVIQIASAWRINTISIVRARADIDQVRKLLTGLGSKFVVTDEEMKNDSVTDAFWQQIPRPKLALNAVGGKQMLRISQLLDDNGLCVTYGGMSALPVMIPTQAFVFKNQTYTGFWLTKRELGQRTETDRTEWEKMLKDLSELAVTGRLRPPVCELRHATDWRQAFEITQNSAISAGSGAEKIIHRAKQILTFYDPEKDG